MNVITNFRTFFWLILAAFMFTWIGFVVFPWLELGHLPPVEDEESGTITPWDAPGAAHAGERVYAADGCAYCHTQQVRAETSGADIIRGWGTATDPDDPKKEITRRTYPRDYIWQGQVFLGNSREGADLSNVAERFPDAAKLYSYLYDPYVLNPHSSMPEYRFLFVMQKISGEPSQDALVLPPADAPPAGYEIVPTARAKSLVAYLLSLKKNYHLKPDEAGVPYVPPSPNS
ncbi:MAG TPA: cbb3-type cytochrome c oxidase subunit II [Candidatus Methylacidiphilales bacterium]|jgi:cytochrome c oxidase cbb3-type subunit 2|nr:cbb3-type cytochrome c oxidase subunit II [Candidatus Methylacidiphilales bacterium]